jgi:branched-chain amino acid transport system substrate-binding protein
MGWACIFLTAWALAACDGSKEPDAEPDAERDTVPILLVVPRTGPLAGVGNGMIVGAEMALADYLQSHPGIKPKPRLVIQDETAPDYRPGGLAAFGKAPVVVGHALESTLSLARPTYLATRTVVLLPLIGSPQAQESGQGWFYRLMASDEEQGRALGLFAAQKLKARNTLALVGDAPWCPAAAKGFGEAAAGAGAQARSLVLPPDDPGIDALVQRPGAGPPDAVLLAASPRKALASAAALHQAGVKAPLLGTHVLGRTDILPLLEAMGFSVHLSLPVDPLDPPESARSFFAEFERERHKGADWVMAASYDAVRLALQGLETSGGKPDALKAFLDGTQAPDKAWLGLAGTYRFGPGSQSSSPVAVVTAGPRLLNHLPETKD